MLCDWADWALHGSGYWPPRLGLKRFPPQNANSPYSMTRDRDGNAVQADFLFQAK